MQFHVSKRLLFTAVIFCAPAFSQLFSIGVKGGVPLTDAYSGQSSGSFSTVPYDNRYIIGPTAEIHLPLHFAFEVDALYRRNGVDYGGPGIAGAVAPFNIRTAVNDWQFPFLGKYELHFGPLRPFVDAGVVFRHISTSGSANRFVPTNPNTAGFAVGGGVALKLLFIRLSPEIRYSHWPTALFNDGSGLIHSNSNQADFLVGFTF